jgi:hypothetical protein
VHLSKFLKKEYCEKLTKELQELVSQNKTEKDEQCPLSEATYGAKLFDRLLVELLPFFEDITQKRLEPTYSYARLYAPGEELTVHIDRPSCEISATITLGFEGDVWPFYVGDDENKSNPVEINMEVGDVVLYYGTEKYHWREKYTQGKWQAQVFLHYVDDNGPYVAEHIYDGRSGINYM